MFNTHIYLLSDICSGLSNIATSRYTFLTQVW